MKLTAHGSIIVVLAALVSVSSPALAGTLPDLKYKTYCRSIANAGGVYSIEAYVACCNVERGSRVRLTQSWRQIASKTKRFCLGIISNDAPSYGVLEACVQNKDLQN